MKKYLCCFAALSLILAGSSCEKKKESEEKIESTQLAEPAVDQKENETHEELESSSSYESYNFGENLKSDSFFLSDNTGKTIELQNVGITSYFVSDGVATLIGVFYNKEKNMAIPYKNYPPGSDFVSQYFDKLEMKYDEIYKSNYSAALLITLKNAKDIKKLKIYNPSEPALAFEYKLPGTDQFRSGFLDLVTISGKFSGKSPNEQYPNQLFEIESAEIR
jgi:hypothetical protein